MSDHLYRHVRESRVLKFLLDARLLQRPLTGVRTEIVDHGSYARNAACDSPGLHLVAVIEDAA